jgi:hypothetical protein
VRGEAGEDIPQRHFARTRPLRERLEYLVARYPTWYRHGESGAPWRSPWCLASSGRPWKGGEWNS